MKKTILTLSLLSATLIHADITPLLQVSLDGGGDEVAIAQYTNGTSEELYAGSGYTIEGGLSFQTLANQSNIETQLLLGYKFDSLDASNGSMSISRVTVTALEMYTMENNFNVAAGLTYHISPEVSGDGYASNLNESFDSAIGGVLQVGYKIDTMNIGLKATFMDYDLSGSNKSVSANSVGLFVNYAF